jgi:SAM-dependent methyltransferase
VAVATHVLDVPSTDTADRFTIARCDACGVLRTLPVPTDLAPYYSTDLAATMTEPGSRLFSSLRRMQLARELRRITRHGNPGTIVDIGCGTGDFVRVLAHRGVRVVAADGGSRPPASLATERNVPYVRFDFETYELHDLDVPPPFTVVLRHVLEHVRDPAACLASLIRQGARQFYIVVPNAGSLERRMLGPHWYLWDPPRHLWHFDPRSLADVCARVGLEIVSRGVSTAPILVPSVYRYLRLRGWPTRVYEAFGPTSVLTALTAPVNLLLAGNVLWCVARPAP